MADKDFSWPAPPYFEFVREKDDSGWADCELTFRDGTQGSGQLRGFMADEALLTFQPNGSSAPVEIPFSVLLKLHLPRPLVLRRETLPEAATAAETEKLRRSESYSFRLEMVNGELFLGLTVGYISALSGLFLYLPNDGGDVSRCFVPALATKTCSIDVPIGQVLVDQRAVSPEAVKAALDLQGMFRSQRLGEYLVENNIVSPDQLAVALELKRDRPDRRLGDTLIGLGYMSRPELDMAVGSDTLERTMPIGQILLKKMGIVDQSEINKALASRLGIPSISLNTTINTNIASEILDMIPAAFVHSRRVLPICQVEGALAVVMEDPTDNVLREELGAITRMKILPVSTSAEDLANSIEKHYGAAPNTAQAGAPIIDRRKVSRATSQSADPLARTGAGVEELISRLKAESGNQDVAE
ncbi:MAG: hypothetical protein JJE42_17460, partial [Burkholderiales bacterium]|nr:hypothetical protein [Burkholderiales bacterium]